MRAYGCSPAWTRTRNRPINSRKLCQLSYRGLLIGARNLPANRGMTLAHCPTNSGIDHWQSTGHLVPTQAAE
jgi:hypothetical protein